MKKNYKRTLLIGLMMLMFVSLTLVGCGNDKNSDNDKSNGTNSNNQALANGEKVIADFKKTVDVNKVIAELDDIKITYGDFLDSLEAEDILKPGVAEYVIENKDTIFEDYAKQLVIRQKVYNDGMAMNIKTNDKAIEDEMSFVKMTNPDLSDARLEKVKKLYTYYDVLTETLNELVTDGEALMFFERNPEEFLTASVRHILVAFEGRTEEEAKTKADELTERIRNGEDMATLAAEHTDDPGSKTSGGLYENQPVMMWVEEFKQAAIDMELNVIGEPVKTSYGYHVMRVEDREHPEYEKVKAMIKRGLANEKYEEYIDNYEDKIKTEFTK